MPMRDASYIPRGVICMGISLGLRLHEIHMQQSNLPQAWFLAFIPHLTPNSTQKMRHPWYNYESLNFGREVSAPVL